MVNILSFMLCILYHNFRNGEIRIVWSSLNSKNKETKHSMVQIKQNMFVCHQALDSTVVWPAPSIADLVTFLDLDQRF